MSLLAKDHSGEIILLDMPTRRVVRLPGDIVVKSGRYLSFTEDALRKAADIGIQVPRVLGTEITADGFHAISMSYVDGSTLAAAWKNLSADDRKQIARQLRTVVQKCGQQQRRLHLFEHLTLLNFTISAITMLPSYLRVLPSENFTNF